VFTYRVELVLMGAFRFVRPLVGATMRKGLRSDLARLRGLLESARMELDDPATD
jgi:hypothetical protein